MPIPRYVEGEVNHCPGCGRSQWLIGRLSAECAFCSTAVPLSVSHDRHDSTPVVVRRENAVWSDAA
jgi:hypothetical protein